MQLVDPPDQRRGKLDGDVFVDADGMFEPLRWNCQHPRGNDRSGFGKKAAVPIGAAAVLGQPGDHGIAEDVAGSKDGQGMAVA
jgi:hypothetical protein